MIRRFTSVQLTYLRNQVPISRVIEDLPELATRHADGKLRFGCRKNVNPIELVIHRLQNSFFESVKWLLQRSAYKSTTNPAATGRVSTQPAAVSDILAGMLSVQVDRKTESLPADTIPQRISHFEQNVRHLYRLIDELRSSCQEGFAGSLA
jgi:hypothetical protein